LKNSNFAWGKQIGNISAGQMEPISFFLTERTKLDAMPPPNVFRVWPFIPQNPG